MEAPLPDAERESLLEDLENHLAEVASESGLPLRERLGKPVLVRMGTGSTYTFSSEPFDPYLSSVSAGYYPNFTNIYPYSKDGKPLRDVLLYDQDGRPLVPAKSGVVTDVPIGADGLPIPNSYPLTQRDPNGDPVVPPRVALPPQRASSPAASPTPSPSP